MIASANAFAGTFIDTVYSFKPGTVQFVGQSEEYFPMNIFGPPAANATRFVPASAPEDVCSIGIEGEIIVGLKSGIIHNGIGNDFIIFENAFERIFDSAIFAEPAVIAVSQNGTDFIEFPYDEWTLNGLAGKTPTNGGENPFDYLLAGGDAFDLEDLGLDYITHIKIRDISQIVSKSTDHPYYQPEFMVTGFDLDAVAILYPQAPNTYIEPAQEKDFQVVETHDRITINSNSIINIKIFNSIGTLIAKIDNRTNVLINKFGLPSGLYIISIESNGMQYFHKMIIL